ncbi:hypothetical protein Tco_1018485 [Tanacetum coccineum]|uniref:Uncharacterized protein n=1 Tax=Tanacetum coccineum TaxID=301880 RepID=A0ABQ5FVW7_9ASTR
MASAVALGIYLAYIPYEEEFQYLAFILAILMPLIVLAISVDLFWKEYILLLGEGESSLIPSSGRCPIISGYVAKLLAISALYGAWHLMPFVLLARASIVVTFPLPLVASILCYLVFLSDLIFSGGGDTDGGSDDEGSAAANSIMHASVDGDRGVTSEGSAGVGWSAGSSSGSSSSSSESKSAM